MFFSWGLKVVEFIDSWKGGWKLKCLLRNLLEELYVIWYLSKVYLDFFELKGVLVWKGLSK